MRSKANKVKACCMRGMGNNSRFSIEKTFNTNPKQTAAVHKYNEKGVHRFSDGAGSI